MAATKIKIEVDINVSVHKAWKYWTDVIHITNWNFASDDWHCPSADNDLRVGGRFRSQMEARDGSFGFEFGGVYDEVVMHERIAYTLDDGRIVEVVFQDKGDSTRVISIFEAEDSNSIDMQRDGWQAILNNYKKYTEEN
jgi:uncharacterized protein YndB with AHSA1/START domain